MSSFTFLIKVLSPWNASVIRSKLSPVSHLRKSPIKDVIFVRSCSSWWAVFGLSWFYCVYFDILGIEACSRDTTQTFVLKMMLVGPVGPVCFQCISASLVNLKIFHFITCWWWCNSSAHTEASWYRVCRFLLDNTSDFHFSHTRHSVTTWPESCTRESVHRLGHLALPTPLKPHAELWWSC